MGKERCRGGMGGSIAGTGQMESSTEQDIIQVKAVKLYMESGKMGFYWGRS